MNKPTNSVMLPGGGVPKNPTTPPVPEPVDLYDAWLRRQQQEAREQYEKNQADPRTIMQNFGRENFERRRDEAKPGFWQSLAPGLFGNSFTGQPGLFNPNPKTPFIPAAEAYQSAAQQGLVPRTQKSTPSYGQGEGFYPTTPPATDWLAKAMEMLGGGPDYGAYRSALTDQTGELNSRIQAMYKELAKEAGANQKRVSDVYDTAKGDVGAVYDSASQNIADAYASSQQQATDQMARLGLADAAGMVLPQAATQQAAALSGIEQGRAGGLGAVQRYGTTAQDFASQMGQVAQQQGTEFNTALLNSLQRQLAESLAMETQGAYDARLRAPGLANELYQASQIGQPQGPSFSDQLAMQGQAFSQGQAAVDQYNQNERMRQDYLALLLKSGFKYPEAVAEVELQYPRLVF
jgi:hypothetical protein